MVTRTAINVVTIRAGELRPGDVYLRKIPWEPAVWATVLLIKRSKDGWGGVTITSRYRDRFFSREVKYAYVDLVQIQQVAGESDV